MLSCVSAQRPEASSRFIVKNLLSRFRQRAAAISSTADDSVKLATNCGDDSTGRMEQSIPTSFGSCSGSSMISDFGLALKLITTTFYAYNKSDRCAAQRRHKPGAAWAAPTASSAAQFPQ